MDGKEASVVLNVDGEPHKVVGGNTFYGDAHFHIHGDAISSKKAGKEENLTSAGHLDPEVEQMLTKLNLMSLRAIFVKEELTIS